MGYCEKEGTYYELTDEQLATILAGNQLDSKKLNQLGFYTRYGGKILGLVLLALIIRGFAPGKKKNTQPIEV